WSGDGGVVYRLAPEVALAANAGRAWRAPTLFELFANGPHIGEARFEKGSAGLVPEASLNLDSSLRWQGHRSRGELAVYRNTINHYIYITPTAGTQDSLPVYQYMQADAVLTGLEASLDIQPWTPITVRGGIDAVRGWRRDSGAPLPSMPPLRSTLGIEWQERTLTGEEREKVGVELEAVARQTRLDSLDIPTAGYRLVHLPSSVQRPPGGDSGGRVGRRTLRIDLQIRNVANTRYRDFLSRYKGFALNPGRNIILGVSTEF